MTRKSKKIDLVAKSGRKSKMCETIENSAASTLPGVNFDQTPPADPFFGLKQTKKNAKKVKSTPKTAQKRRQNDAQMTQSDPGSTQKMVQNHPKIKPREGKKCPEK